MKADRVNTVVFNLHQIKRLAFVFCFGTPDSQRDSQAIHISIVVHRMLLSQVKPGLMLRTKMRHICTG